VDGYHGYVRQNYCQWFEAGGYGNYWTSEMDDYEGLTAEQAKELDEAHSAYETGENLISVPTANHVACILPHEEGQEG
jgi:hypothetical protein